MADRKPRTETTAEERSAQLAEKLAAQKAARVLDTFDAATPTGAAVASAPIAETTLRTEAPGFGETEHTEVSGDAGLDQDLHEAAGDEVENEELSEGQEEVAKYKESRSDMSRFAPRDPGGTSPTIEDRAAQFGIDSSGREQGSGGGSGGDSVTSTGTNSGFPEGLNSGAEAVAAAGGAQGDFANLVGNPQDLVQPGAGNSAAAASDDVHSALGALVEDEMNSTMDKTSVAGDGEDAAVAGTVAVGAAAAAHSAVATAALVGEASVALAAGVVSLSVAAVGGAGIAGVAIGSMIEEEVGDIIHGVDSESETAYKAALGRIEGQNRKEAREAQQGAGGGVKDSDRDDDRPSGPPTESEKLLRDATNRLLGRNDALVHGPATQIDPGEQGEAFQRGTALLPDSQARKESMIGIPREDGARPTGGRDLGVDPPAPGPDGTEVLVEDGNPFTGGQRSEGPEDVQFGPSEPLVGFADSSSESESSEQTREKSSFSPLTRIGFVDEDSDDS